MKREISRDTEEIHPSTHPYMNEEEVADLRLLTVTWEDGCQRVRTGCSMQKGALAAWHTPLNWPSMLSSSPLRSQRQGASPVGVGDDTREAWSCPPPNEIFTVGSQGQDEDIAGLGVAIALHRLLAAGSTPARHASDPLDPVPLCLPPH